jgi:5'(3')-deoxyribonucleotidase
MRTFDPKVNKIYCDADGVLVDFDQFVIDHKELGEKIDQSIGDDNKMWEIIVNTPHFFLHLNPTPYFKELWKCINSFGCKVEILTALPYKNEMPEAKQDKIDWFAKYIPEVKVNFGPTSKDKWKWCKPGDILIDDKVENIHDWINKGQGIGILHVWEDGQATMALLKGIMETNEVVFC